MRGIGRTSVRMKSLPSFLLLLHLFFFLALLFLVPASVKDSVEYNMQGTGRESSWSSFGFVFTDHLVHSLVRKIEG